MYVNMADQSNSLVKLCRTAELCYESLALGMAKLHQHGSELMALYDSNNEQQTPPLVLFTLDEHSDAYEQLKAKIHEQLMNELELLNFYADGIVHIVNGFERFAAEALAGDLGEALSIGKLQQQRHSSMEESSNASPSSLMQQNITTDSSTNDFVYNYRFMHDDLTLIINHFRRLNELLKERLEQISEVLAFGYNPPMEAAPLLLLLEHWLEPELYLNLKPSKIEAKPQWAVHLALQRLKFTTLK